MQKVWVLERWTYDNRDIIGMFFSKHTAEQALAKIKEVMTKPESEYDIVDFDAYYEVQAWLADPDVQYRMKVGR